MSTIHLILVTAPINSPPVEEMIRALLEARLVSCVNRIPNISSLYWWEGAIEQSQEELLILKTTNAQLPKLERKISELHPYDTPEFLVVPVEHASAAYAQWIHSETSR